MNKLCACMYVVYTKQFDEEQGRQGLAAKRYSLVG